MATSPTTPAAEAPRDPWLGRLILPVILYLVLFAGFHYAQGLLLREQAPRLLDLIPEARRTELLGQALASKLITQLAALSVAFLALGFLLNWRHGADPMAGVGLSLQLRSLVVALECFLLGLLLHLVALLVLAALGAPPAGHTLAILRMAAVVAFNLAEWAQFGWAALLALPAAAFTYATARLLLPVGHLSPLLRRRANPAVASLCVALLVAAPYLLSSLTTPLAFLNFVLFGLVLDRIRINQGSLWPALAAMTGWVVVGELSGFPHQAMPVEITAPLFAGLPPLLSGGRCGPEGGLVVTALVLGWLAFALRHEPRATETAPA